MSAETVEIVKAVFAAWNDRDREAALALSSYRRTSSTQATT
jgi:hypothetical protein